MSQIGRNSSSVTPNYGLDNRSTIRTTGGPGSVANSDMAGVTQGNPNQLLIAQGEPVDGQDVEFIDDEGLKSRQKVCMYVGFGILTLVTLFLWGFIIYASVDVLNK